MDYGALITRAWRIVWEHKYMLVLGFLAALGGGGTGAGVNNFSYSFSGSDFGLSPETVESWGLEAVSLVPLVLGFVAVAILVGLILWLVSLAAHGGLISAADAYDQGTKMSAGEALSLGARSTVRLALLDVVLFGVAVTLLAGLVASLVATIAAVAAAGEPFAAEDVGALAGLGISGLCLISFCLMCLLLPLFLVAAAVQPFARRSIVLEGTPVLASIRRGWDIVRANVGAVIIFYVLFLIIGLVVSLLVSLVTVPIIIAAGLPAILRLGRGVAIGFGDAALVTAAGLLVAIIAAAISAVLAAFRSATYTLAFNEFEDRYNAGKS